jgi:hypothetical protein
MEDQGRTRTGPEVEKRESAAPERTGWAPEGDRRAGPVREAGREGPGASVTSGQYTLGPEPNYFLLMQPKKDYVSGRFQADSRGEGGEARDLCLSSS